MTANYVLVIHATVISYLTNVILIKSRKRSERYMLRLWATWGIQPICLKKTWMKEKTRDFMGWSLNKHGMTLCPVLKFNVAEWDKRLWWTYQRLFALRLVYTFRCAGE